jgi:HAD superfamily hydrolase (TIGR01509 family)
VSQLRVALFDLDGTLVDSLPTIAAAMSAAGALHGHHATPEEIVPRVGAPMEILAAEMFGVTPEVAEAINQDYLRLYHADFLPQTPPHEGATALIEALRSAGVTLGIVTNKRLEGAERMLALQGWNSLFDVVHGRDSSVPKPDARAALAALEVLDARPQEAAFVGDTEFDMNCGRDAGLAMVIGITGVRDADALRAEGATHVVDRLDQVTPLLLGAGVTS